MRKTVRVTALRVAFAFLAVTLVGGGWWYVTVRRRNWPLREALHCPIVATPLSLSLPDSSLPPAPGVIQPVVPYLSQTASGSVVWEAEWANRITGTFEVLPCRGAGGNLALWAREGTGRNNQDGYVPPQYPYVDPGIADYYVRLPRGGRYHLFLRIWASDACGNSCWVGVDPQSRTDLHYFPGGVTGRFGASHYHWPEVMFHRWLWINDEGRCYRLEAGLHRLRVEVREDGFAIDQIALVPAHRAWPQTLLAPTLVPGWPDSALTNVLSTTTPSTRKTGTLTPFDARFAVDNHCLADGSPVVRGWLWLRSNTEAPQTLSVTLSCKQARIAPASVFRCRLTRRSPFGWLPVTARFPASVKRSCFDLTVTAVSDAVPTLTVSRSCRLQRPLDWWVAGPFPDSAAAVVDQSLAPAASIDLSRPPVPQVPPANWRRAHAPEHFDKFGALDFNLLFGHQEHALAYAVTRLRVDRSGRYGLVAAADDQLRLWCDGDMLLTENRCRPLTDVIQKIVVPLDRGVHLLVARVTQHTRYWQLLVRFEDEHWNPTQKVFGLQMGRKAIGVGSP